jgi:DNA mismatch repair protein MLH1
VYSATLPQASKPFIYMSIHLPSEHVDVNIHPTKKEVYCDPHPWKNFSRGHF